MIFLATSLLALTIAECRLNRATESKERDSDKHDSLQPSRQSPGTRMFHVRQLSSSHNLFVCEREEGSAIAAVYCITVLLVDNLYCLLEWSTEDDGDSLLSFLETQKKAIMSSSECSEAGSHEDGPVSVDMFVAVDEDENAMVAQASSILSSSEEDYDIIFQDTYGSDEQFNNIFVQPGGHSAEPTLQSSSEDIFEAGEDGHNLATGEHEITAVQPVDDDGDTTPKSPVNLESKAGGTIRSQLLLVEDLAAIFDQEGHRKSVTEQDSVAAEEITSSSRAEGTDLFKYATSSGDDEEHAARVFGRATIIMVGEMSSVLDTRFDEESEQSPSTVGDSAIHEDLLSDVGKSKSEQVEDLNTTVDTDGSESVSSDSDHVNLQLPPPSYEKIDSNLDKTVSLHSSILEDSDEEKVQANNSLDVYAGDGVWKSIQRASAKLWMRLHAEGAKQWNRKGCRIVVYILAALIALIAVNATVAVRTAKSRKGSPSATDVSTTTNTTASNHPSTPSPTVSPAPTVKPTFTSQPTITNQPMTASLEPSQTLHAAPVLIVAGNTGDTYSDHNGFIWHSDLDFLVTSEEQAPAYKSTNPLCLDEHSTAPEVRHSMYCWGRRGKLGYEIPLSRGTYTVTLHFLTLEQSQVETIIEGVARSESRKEDTIDQPFIVSRDFRVEDGFLSIQIVQNTVFVGMEIHGRRSSEDEEDASYIPGNLVAQEEGLILSEGLTAKIIAVSSERVQYTDGSESSIDFHLMPDAAETYPDPRPGNAGGWIYVSNSEAKPVNRDEGTDQTPGGVGAITFDSMGKIINYKMLLENTRQNCGGGPTPWGAWISGEEYSRGKIWQVDPTGIRTPERIMMGERHHGYFESFAYYIPSRDEPQFFMTQDRDDGELRRFIPSNPNWEEPWTILMGNGTQDYLEIVPDSDEPNKGTYRWTTNHEKGEQAALDHFRGAEGIDVVGDQLYFVSKEFKTMFVLDLVKNTYSNQTTRDAPLLDGQPDQIERLFDPVDDKKSDLYFTQDGGRYAGISAMNSAGQCFTVLESHEYSDETTGLAFSPDGYHLYFAFQDEGLLFDVTRGDGLPFHEQTLDIKYHNVLARRRKGRRT